MPLSSLLLVTITALPAAQTPPAVTDGTGLPHYVQSEAGYDQAVPKPSSVLGFEVGEWHIRHDLLVEYFRALAASSPRVHLLEYARSHERRPLLLAAITAPENIGRLDELRAEHLRATFGESSSADSGPLVVWLGYSVHGNEPSGGNASLPVAYHLAASQDPSVVEMLKNTVVLVDPCLNPDGFSRFAQWANSHRGKRAVADPAHREHNEVWPGGRTNHYWFDLNRDWLLGTHPESRGRLEQFHRWMPHVLTDHHEMGTNSTFFFQPGIPTRQNPITPQRNLDLTREIARFHARALDAQGRLYYTEESFDDFYYGKGSTYPDINGGVGILFEQASSRGHAQENSYGGIDFSFTVQNQYTVSLSTLAAADSMRAELQQYQREFFASAMSDAESSPLRGWVFAEPRDRERARRLIELLHRHQIRVHRLARDVEIDGQEFAAADAFVVPVAQRQSRLVRALFETRTSWPDNTFYDVSSWTLPLSFGVAWAGLDVEHFRTALLGEAVEEATFETGRVEAAENPVAWAFEWHHYHAPRTLQRLLDGGARVRVATRTFAAETAAGVRRFDLGTIVIPRGVQEVDVDLVPLLNAAAEDGVEVSALIGGLTPEGVDLGSNNLRDVPAPKPLLVVGRGVSGYESGEAWHYLDARLGMDVSLVEGTRFGGTDLARYTHVVMVQGASGAIGESGTEALKRWIRGGGILVATKGSAAWATESILGRDAPEGGEGHVDESPESPDEDESDEVESEEDEEVEDEEPAKLAKPAYADYSNLRAQQRIAGTIFRVHLDRTHPLCFGFSRDSLPVFRNSNTVLALEDNPFARAAWYTDSPLVSGFAPSDAVEDLAGSPALMGDRYGRGAVIRMIDNPLFRGVWYGTEKLLANAIFFGPALQRTTALDEQVEEEVDSHGHAKDVSHEHD